MRKLFAVVVAGMLLASAACDNDSTGPGRIPADGMHGLYIGNTTKADIRLQVAYGIPVGACSTGPVADRIICQLLAENLHGSGSITIRETGEVQAFQITGAQGPFVGITFHPQAGVMLGTKLGGSMSSEGKTLQATIYPGLTTPLPSIFGDSTSVTFVRQ